MRKYNLEYKQDFDMLSEYESNLQLWRSHVYGNLTDLATQISTVSRDSVKLKFGDFSKFNVII